MNKIFVNKLSVKINKNYLYFSLLFYLFKHLNMYSYIQLKQVHGGNS